MTKYRGYNRRRVIGSFFERYFQSHGFLWIPILFIVYGTIGGTLGLLTYFSRGEAERRRRRRSAILLVLWVFAVPGCMVLEDVGYRASLRPENLFETAFGFPLPANVVIVSHSHYDNFDATQTWLELSAPPDVIERFISNPDLHWHPGMEKDVDSGIDEAKACAGASRTYSSRTPTESGARNAFLCVHDSSGRVEFYDSSFD